MSFNRKFVPNVWEAPQQIHPAPPFTNNPPNFYPNQGNLEVWNNQGNSHFNQNFQQNHNQNIRPLLSLQNNPIPDHPQQFRRFNNNNNQEYRRPGPVCSRNNYGNNPTRWNKDNRRGDFKNRERRVNDGFESHNNTTNNSFNNNNDDRNQPYVNFEHPPPEICDGNVTKFNSLVEHLKAVHNAKPVNNQQDRSKSEIDAICVKNASEASKKLLNQLKTMDKDGVKDLVNNPKQPYKKKVLNLQAREKLRQQMREKLKRLGNESDSLEFQLEPDECIDYDKLPESLIVQIGKTIDMNIDSDDMDLSESINEFNIEDKDIEVVKTNLGNDFLMGSEMLLMNGFSLLAETENETDAELPPLPTEPQSKPPSPPPEPDPSPSPERLADQKPVFSSLDKPWELPSGIIHPTYNNPSRRVEDEWDIESAKNPDPPCPPCETVIKEEKNSVATPPAEKICETEQKQKLNDVAEMKIVATENIHIASEERDVNVPVPVPVPVTVTVAAPASNVTTDQNGEPNRETGKRANETYGDYRRRIAAEREQANVENNNDNFRNNNRTSSKTGFNQNQRKGNNWRDNERDNRGGSNGRRDGWTSNNRQNNLNDPRLSRWESDRGRDSDDYKQRNLSRDTNNSHDSGRQSRTFDDVKDVHNYRFQNDSHSEEPPIERLNTILNPKPLQFKGSFNKRSQGTNQYNPRSRSRDRAAANSMDRDFDEAFPPSSNDVRPCLTTLKKVMEIDAEMNRIHDKIHGIDKVISNLQSERISHQKAFSRLQHNRKVLFDNLMKRALSNVDLDKTESAAKPSAPSPVPETAVSPSQKVVMEKKLQNIIDQKKRKHEEQPEEPKTKKAAVEETTSAAEKAAKLAKEREEEQRRQQNLEKKRIKRLRMEKRERAERERLEEKVQQEATATTTITIETRERSIDKSKSTKSPHHQQGKSQKTDKKSEPSGPKSFLFKQSETLPCENLKISGCQVNLNRLQLSDNLKETFNKTGFLEVYIEDFERWSKPRKEVDEVMESTEINEDPSAIAEHVHDFLGLEEVLVNPPTPGSNITPQDEESMLVELPMEQDYSEWSGEFSCHDQPIVHLQNVDGKFVVCACENGKLYKYHLSNGKIAGVFSKHTQICNSFLYDAHGFIYTVSSDGYLYKIKFKTFQLMGSENYQEELQVIEKSKAGIFIGTKAGRIFKTNTDLRAREQEPICNLGTLILCMRAARDGSKNILLVSSKTNPIQVRDANDGLLLRTMADDLTGISIYDILIDGSTIYCGGDRRIFTIDFHSGALKKSRPCGGVAICVKLYKNYLIAACYNGNIYIFNTKNNDDAVNICGPSNMLLAMDLWDDKIIAATKDKTLKIMSIQT